MCIFRSCHDCATCQSLYNLLKLDSVAILALETVASSAEMFDFNTEFWLRYISFLDGPLKEVSCYKLGTDAVFLFKTIIADVCVMLCQPRLPVAGGTTPRIVLASSFGGNRFWLLVNNHGSLLLIADDLVDEGIKPYKTRTC